MRFTWDPKKSAANLEVRGFDFAFATLIFEGPTLQREDRRKAYGERRIVAVGIAQGLHNTLVFTDRPLARDEVERRIISARRSNRRERKAFSEALKR